jgi:hypothetical protein
MVDETSLYVIYLYKKHIYLQIIISEFVIDQSELGLNILVANEKQLTFSF